MTSVTFTNNLSDTLTFNGFVKFKVEGMIQGQEVVLYEENIDATGFDRIEEEWAIIKTNRSTTQYLIGNYKIRRTNDNISVGYTE
jgi:hypothetical protein